MAGKIREAVLFVIAVASIPIICTLLYLTWEGHEVVKSGVFSPSSSDRAMVLPATKERVASGVSMEPVGSADDVQVAPGSRGVSREQRRSHTEAPPTEPRGARSEPPATVSNPSGSNSQDQLLSRGTDLSKHPGWSPSQRTGGESPAGEVPGSGSKAASLAKAPSGNEGTGEVGGAPSLQQGSGLQSGSSHSPTSLRNNHEKDFINENGIYRAQYGWQALNQGQIAQPSE